VTPLTTWQTVIAVVGLAIFGYGIRANSSAIRWVGIGCLVVAFAFRFVKRRQQRDKF
jgi:hypothetical protein